MATIDEFLGMSVEQLLALAELGHAIETGSKEGFNPKSLTLDNLAALANKGLAVVKATSRKIRKAMVAQKLTPQTVADRAGISVSYVHTLMNGDVSMVHMAKWMKEKVCSLLKLSYEDTFGFLGQ